MFYLKSQLKNNLKGFSDLIFSNFKSCLFHMILLLIQHVFQRAQTFVEIHHIFFKGHDPDQICIFKQKLFSDCSSDTMLIILNEF